MPAFHSHPVPIYVACQICGSGGGSVAASTWLLEPRTRAAEKQEKERRVRRVWSRFRRDSALEPLQSPTLLSPSVLPIGKISYHRQWRPSCGASVESWWCYVCSESSCVNNPYTITKSTRHCLQHAGLLYGNMNHSIVVKVNLLLSDIYSADIMVSSSLTISATSMKLRHFIFPFNKFISNRLDHHPAVQWSQLA